VNRVTLKRKSFDRSLDRFGDDAPCASFRARPGNKVFLMPIVSLELTPTFTKERETG
jgi:hypothetical protein